MRQNLLFVALAAFALSLTACSDGTSEATAEHGDHDGHDHGESQEPFIYNIDGTEVSLQESASSLLADATVYPVACGCSQGGACANLVEVGGEYVPLKGDLGLGVMEFCGQDGLHAAMIGVVEDGEFVATAYELRK